MDYKSFIENAIKTESVVDELNVDRGLLVNALELFIVSTEILDAIKKAAFYNNQTKLEQLPLLNEKARTTLDDLVRTTDSNWRCYYPDTVNTRVAHGVIGICTESGELAECFLSNLLGGELDKVNLAEEMFDQDWYKAVISDELDIEWSEHWQRIIDKLKARYGDKFDETRANVRNLELERKILEG